MIERVVEGGFSVLRCPCGHATHSHKVIISSEPIHPIHQRIHGLHPRNRRSDYDRGSKHWVTEERVVNRSLRRVFEVTERRGVRVAYGVAVGIAAATTREAPLRGWSGSCPRPCLVTLAAPRVRRPLVHSREVEEALLSVVVAHQLSVLLPFPPPGSFGKTLLVPQTGGLRGSTVVAPPATEVLWAGNHRARHVLERMERGGRCRFLSVGSPSTSG